jgi:WD40 repeat protein
LFLQSPSLFLCKGPATSVAFSKQGDYFASGGQDQQVRYDKLKKKIIYFISKGSRLENKFRYNCSIC